MKKIIQNFLLLPILSYIENRVKNTILAVVLKSAMKKKIFYYDCCTIKGFDFICKMAYFAI